MYEAVHIGMIVAMCKCCRRIRKIGPIYKKSVTIASSSSMFFWDKSMILTSLGTPKKLQFNINIIILCLMCNLCRCWFANLLSKFVKLLFVLTNLLRLNALLNLLPMPSFKDLVASTNFFKFQRNKVPLQGSTKQNAPSSFRMIVVLWC